MPTPFISTPRIVSPLKHPQSHREQQSPQQNPHHHPSTPSPNYFGFQASEDGTFLNDAPYHTKKNWSPPSSTVRSTAAASPSVVPVDQNPDFDAFRRQSEGKAFNLGNLGNFKMNAPAARQNPRRTTGKISPPVMDGAKSLPQSVSDSRDMAAPMTRHLPNQSLDPASAESARSPKRLLSPGSAAQPEGQRRGSPASFLHGDSERAASQPRFELPLDSQNGPFGYGAVTRSETLPAGGPNESDGQLMVTPQYVINLLGSKPEEILLLDLRVATLYTNSHITGALSLCIPTTLLKRPSFNVQKLADTFKDEEQRSKFIHWKSSSHIVVYDSASAQLKDAQICVNTIKKFQSEGYEGILYIIKGGFTEFSKTFPNFTVTGTRSDGRDADDGGPEVAPVAGGCPMPATDKPANPFFGNIRQNMDLIGGVGQIALKHPSNVSASMETEYPEWLRRAADDKDQGKKVSYKFEAIERREKKRMEEALSGAVSYGSPKPQETRVKQVQIAGIEKGNKNRYNNIWPFEHTRVKLQGVPTSGCDYFNANHIKAAWSNKRYVSTQAPIPATFNDFWNVIWQQDARVIVMLTAEKEGAQVKAHNYWDQKQYGPLRLEFLSEKRASIEPSRIHNHQLQKQRPGIVKRSSTRSANPQIPLATIDSRDVTQEQPYVIVRKFTLSHERRPFEPMREITQLQYTSWPDFGAPAHPAHLLGLVEQTDAVVRATSSSHSSPGPVAASKRPVVVHCSAGCGRTGTFCTVDSVIDMMKRQRSSHQSKQQSGAMDIDEKPLPKKVSTPGYNLKKDSKQDSGGDFFSSQPRQSSGSLTELDGGTQGSDEAWLDDGTIDLVEKTVEDFRHQRLSMVQSLRQYVLCYESVMEWLLEERRDREEQ